MVLSDIKIPIIVIVIIEIVVFNYHLIDYVDVQDGEKNSKEIAIRGAVVCTDGVLQESYSIQGEVHNADVIFENSIGSEEENTYHIILFFRVC